MYAGVQQYPGGESYDGEWKDDMKSGKGEPKRSIDLNSFEMF
jgi:hypothetical protein